MILGIIHKFPYLFGINPVFQKTSFLVFQTFRELRDSKRARSKSTVQNFWDERNGLKLKTRSPTGWKIEGPTRPPLLATWAHLFCPSELRCRRSLLHQHSLDLKMPIKIAPQGVSRGGGGETSNQETGDRRLPPEKIGGGKRRRNHLRRAPPPSGVFIINIYSKIISISPL